MTTSRSSLDHAHSFALAPTGQGEAPAPRVVEPQKVCGVCGEKKPWSQFYVKVRWPDGTPRQVHFRCKRCAGQSNNAYRRRTGYAAKKWAKLKSDPEEHARVNEDRRWANRRRNAIPEEDWRKGERAVRLDAAPFAAWLADEVDRHGGMAVSRATGIDESQIRRIIDGEQQRVLREMVDQALLKSATGIWELYPDH